MRSDSVISGPVLLVLPLALAHLMLFAAPLLLLAATSFATDETLHAFSLRAWADLLGDPFNWRALANTVKLGILTVLATSCLAIPLALVHMVAGPRLRRVILIAAILPLLTSVVVRSFAWIAILGREGVLSTVLQATGLAGGPVQLLQTEPGLILALAQIEMPLILLPLMSALGRLDPALLDASAVLGSSWRGRCAASCCRRRCPAWSPAAAWRSRHPRPRSSRKASSAAAGWSICRRWCGSNPC